MSRQHRGVAIVLCATQRCGSTMIIEDMRNTGVLGQPEEWFVSWRAGKNDVDWSKALANVFARATGANDVMAVKVMANQLFDIEACLDGVVTRAFTGEYPRFRTVFAKAKWVKLTRRDIVEQAISRVMSRQTGINHATAKAEDQHFAGNLARGLPPDYNASAVYRFGAILREVTSISLENLAWDRFFASHGIVPEEFIYEQVVTDEAMSHLDVLGRLAGLAEPPRRQPRKMIKLANAKSHEWRERFYQDCARNRYRTRLD